MTDRCQNNDEHGAGGLATTGSKKHCEKNDSRLLMEQVGARHPAKTMTIFSSATTTQTLALRPVEIVKRYYCRRRK